MTNETRIINLIKFLNAVFGKGTTGLVANRFSEDEISVEFNGATEYVIQDTDKNWWISQVYCIQGDRETPDDYDTRGLAIVTTSADVARVILRGQHENVINNQIERASIELNPEYAELF